jgi:peptide/nickel transport system permease protein
MALVVASAAAPLWADLVADSGPREIHISETVEVDGEEVDVIARDGTPIGPTWQGRFFLGADANGRDVMVRLLYAGRNSLLIGCAAALATIVFGVALGLLSGYAGGFVDESISGAVNVMWAFPGILLGIALGAALAAGGIDLGPVEISGRSPLIPVFVIAISTVPYIRSDRRASRSSSWPLAPSGCARSGSWPARSCPMSAGRSSSCFR